METNFTVINNNDDLRRKIKKENTIYTIVTIVVIVSLSLTGVSFAIGYTLNHVEWFIGGAFFALVALFTFAAQMGLKDGRPSKASRYLSYTEASKVLSAKMDIENEFATVRLVTENADHTISHHSISFSVVEKTDVTEYVLDLMEEKVYVPYEGSETEAQRYEHDRKAFNVEKKQYNATQKNSKE